MKASTFDLRHHHTEMMNTHREKGIRKKASHVNQFETAPNEIHSENWGGRKRLTLPAGLLCFHSCFPSLMPSSDESVTLQTDFSFKYSLAPAIHFLLKA